MAAKNNLDNPSGKMVDLYNKLIASNPAIERKGATIPYTSNQGHMFTLLTKEGEVGIRLPEKQREKFIKKYKTRLIESYGVVMKEYVQVPEKLLNDTKTVSKYLEISLAYIKSLKPKPTKKTVANKGRI